MENVDCLETATRTRGQGQARAVLRAPETLSLDGSGNSRPQTLQALKPSKSPRWPYGSFEMPTLRNPSISHAVVTILRKRTINPAVTAISRARSSSRYRSEGASRLPSELRVRANLAIPAKTSIPAAATKYLHGNTDLYVVTCHVTKRAMPSQMISSEKCFKQSFASNTLLANSTNLVHTLVICLLTLER
jgi:hypothetical protein